MNNTKQKGFTMIAVIFAIIITLLFVVPLYLTRIKSAKEQKERAKETVDQVEEQLQNQVNDFEQKMQNEMETKLEDYK